MWYKYEASGTAANDQTWSTAGRISVEMQGDFPEVPLMALRESFMKLTKGDAVFGQPGVGCHGPYTITRLLIETEPQ